jgi:hypothetical protein
MRSLWLRSFPALFAFPFFLFAGCDSVVGSEDRVEVRVRNASTIDFSSVVIGFPDQTEAYGAVAARTATDYRTVERAFRYAGVQVTLDGTSLALIPIDYVGEEELDGGSYTYELNVTDDLGSLTFRLVRD